MALCNWYSFSSSSYYGVGRSQNLSSIPKRDSRIRATRADSNTAARVAPPLPDPQIPTHKVTVHDRQRGVVHNFLVPEVSPNLLSFPFSIVASGIDFLNSRVSQLLLMQDFSLISEMGLMLFCK